LTAWISCVLTSLCTSSWRVTERCSKQECGITFKRRGKLSINMGQVVRGLTRTQTAFCCALSVTPPLNECRNCPKWSPNFTRGSVFCINHSERSPQCYQLCSNDAQPHPRVDIDQWTVSLCCLSDVVDIVQKGLSLYADLFPSHILAQPKRSWISTQNCEKRLFGDMHTRTGMSVKSTQTFDSSVKRTEVQAFKVHFTWSLAYCRCAWMWLCVIGMRFAVCLAQMPPSWRRFQMVKVENPTHLAITTSSWKVWHSKRGDIMLEAQSNGRLGSW